MNIFPQRTIESSQWYHTDSLALYQQNISRMPITWPARSWAVSYEFNSTGHRSPEWTEVIGPTYMSVFGSGAALGVGLPLEHTWSQQLGTLLSLNVVNCAEISATVDSVFDSVVALIQRAPSLPRLVVIDWPSIDRQQYWYQGQPVTLGRGEPQSEAESYWWVNHQRSLAETSDLVHRWQRYSNTIATLCQRANIALWQFSSSPSYQALGIDLTQPLITHPGTEKSWEARLEFLARDVTLIKTSKEQRRKGWGELYPQAHPGLYHQQRVIDAYWAAGIEIRY